MVILTADAMLDALWNNSSRIVIDKASIANALAGGVFSAWRATGQPAQGAIPTASAICTRTTTGAFSFDPQTAPASTYGGQLSLLCSNNTTTVEFHDRIAHMGGLSLVSVASQTVNLDLTAAGLNIPADRIGDANYSDVQWWLEMYGDGGATASNATINVTLNDGTDVNLTALAVGGTLRASRMLPLNGLIPQPAQSGKFIRDINTVINSATTGTAGNFGFTATRRRFDIGCPLANFQAEKDFVALASGQLPNDTCLQMIIIPTTTSTGVLRGGGKLAHG